MNALLQNKNVGFLHAKKANRDIYVVAGIHAWLIANGDVDTSAELCL